MRSRFHSFFSGLGLLFGGRRWVWWSLVGLCLVGVVACDSGSNPPVNNSTATPPPAAPPVPPPPPDTAFLALLTPDQTQQIRELGLPLVLPAVVPPGFQVAQLDAQADERFGGYQILYRDDRDRCFLIEYTTGGIGGLPTTESRLPINPPVLTDDTVDYALNYGPYTDPALQAQFPEPSLITDWLPVEAGFVRLAGAALINSTLTPASPCANLTVEEAVAVIDSLAVISENIQGDGAPE